MLNSSGNEAALHNSKDTTHILFHLGGGLWARAGHNLHSCTEQAWSQGKRQDHRESGCQVSSWRACPDSGVLPFETRIQAAPKSLGAILGCQREKMMKKSKCQHRLGAGLLGRGTGLGKAVVPAPAQGVCIKVTQSQGGRPVCSGHGRQKQRSQLLLQSTCCVLQTSSPAFQEAEVSPPRATSPCTRLATSASTW